MKQQPTIPVRAALSVMLFAVLLWSWSSAFTLMNQKSDAEVGIGLFLFLASSVIMLVIMQRMWSKPKNEEKKDATDSPKNIASVLVFVALSFLYSGCYKVVEPGYVGIKINMSGDGRGVDQLPLETGRVFYNPFTQSVFQYPTFVQTAVWTANPHEGKPVNEEITFTTQDQMVVAADISIGYHLIEQKVPAFYVKFRNDDLMGFTHGYMRNLAREKFDGIAGKYKIEQIMGDNLPFLNDVRGALQSDLSPLGVQIDQFGLVSAPRPPDAVIAAINAKVGAVQTAAQKENEIRQAQAEAAKSIAYAEGQAKSNQLLASSISPALLEWRRLAIQEKMIDKWNGVRPSVEAGGSSGFIFNLPQR